MTPEGRVKEMVKRLLKSFGDRVWWYMPVSTGHGQQGIPDFIICANSWFVAVECKAAGGGVTPLQQMQIDRLKQAGALTTIIWDEVGVDMLRTHLYFMVSSNRAVTPE